MSEFVRVQKIVDAQEDSVFLWGARQVGKSTLVAQYTSNHQNCVSTCHRNGCVATEQATTNPFRCTRRRSWGVYDHSTDLRTTGHIRQYQKTNVGITPRNAAGTDLDIKMYNEESTLSKHVDGLYINEIAKRLIASKNC